MSEIENESMKWESKIIT